MRASLPVSLRSEGGVCSSVGGYDFLQQAHILSRVPRMNGFDGDFRSSLDGVRLKAIPDHAARRTGFEGPLFDFAAVADFDVEPRMRIFQTDFSENAFDGNRFILVERGSKRVMRPRRYR